MVCQIPEYSKHLQRTCRQFSEKLFFINSPKPFSQDFLWIFKFSENCPKTHRGFPKKYSRILSKASCRVSKLSVVFKEFETILVNTHFQFCSAADPLGRMALSCPTISPSNCEKAGQDE